MDEQIEMNWVAILEALVAVISAKLSDKND